jgi:hypothetical protein
MNISQTIQLEWNKEQETGFALLYLKEDVILKYTMSDELDQIEENIQAYEGIYTKLKDFEQAQKEIDEYNGILSMYGLAKESSYHGSHIMYLLLHHVTNTNYKLQIKELTRKLHNRVYLLKHLMEEDYLNKYHITIKDKKNDFRYTFENDVFLKDVVFKNLIKHAKVQVRNSAPEIYKLLIDGASEEQLEKAINVRSNNEISKLSLADVIKLMLRYLNDETVSINNNERTDNLSITNQQGDFIYDVLTIFGIYKPKRIAGNSAVKHHDAIRKLVKRSEILDEDK